MHAHGESAALPATPRAPHGAHTSGQPRTRRLESARARNGARNGTRNGARNGARNSARRA
eukprot:6124035-Prymnesium_polylepis.1